MTASLYQNKGAIITGGASGLGAATARKLASDGMRVTIFDIDEAAGTALAKEIGGTFAKVDVTNTSSIQDGIAIAEGAHGTPRILVNCAGIGSAAKTVSRGKPHDAAAFETVITVNLLGSFYTASMVAAAMVSAEPLDSDGSRGVIIQTSSVAATDGQIGQLAYAASKGAIASMTLPMARDLADKGIRVCTIAPGLFKTPLLNELPDDVQASLGAQIPFPSRLGHSDEYAALASHIVHNQFLNGEVIRLDGAIRMGPR